MSFVAPRLKAIKPSPTLAVTAKAARLKAEGKDIIGLGAGEPDFDTPAVHQGRGHRGDEQGPHQVHAGRRHASLKKAIIAKFKRENGLDYTEKQILVSCGGKQSSFNLCLALLNEGDEVDHPGALLGLVSRHGDDGRRQAGLRRRRHRAGIPHHRGAARARDHAEDAAHLPEQPLESDRRDLHRRRT